MNISNEPEIDRSGKQRVFVKPLLKISCAIYVLLGLSFSLHSQAEQVSAVAGGDSMPEKTWQGRTRSEKMFFTLGMMNAYAESVKNRAKILGLGEPLSSEETDALFEYAKVIARHNQVKIYREPELLVTDLFPAHITRNKHVILIYLDDTLEKYLAIKADKASLVQTGKYEGEARKQIARRFGKLLSYSDASIEQKLQRKLNAE